MKESRRRMTERERGEDPQDGGTHAAQTLVLREKLHEKRCLLYRTNMDIRAEMCCQTEESLNLSFTHKNIYLLIKNTINPQTTFSTNLVIEFKRVSNPRHPN